MMRIYVNETGHGGRFAARLDSPAGEVIIESSRQPLLDSARALTKRGFSGKLEMWDARRPYPRMSGDIDKLAALPIREDKKCGPDIRRWRPFRRDGVASPAADLDL